MNITIQPAKRLCGTLTVPGDKSISHRSLLFCAIAEGEATVRGLSIGADVQSMASCLKMLGVTLEFQNTTCRIQGRGLRGLSAPAALLDAGNSGTAMRLLAGVLAGQRFASVLTGDAYLIKRPMARVVQPLSQMGAEISARDGSLAPLHINGSGLQGMRYELPVASAQVQSAILLAGLYAEGDTTVIEPAPIRDHTERMLAYLGVEIHREAHSVTLKPHQTLCAKDIEVPGDSSAAAFWLAAGALVPNSKITIQNTGVNPTRTGFADMLQGMGVAVASANERLAGNEPVADMTVHGSTLRATEIGGSLIPRMIDELPLAAVLATQAQGTTIIKDALEMRVKETDRIAAVTTNLRKMGVELEEREDGWLIPGPQPLQGATLDCFGDHRIAMAFSIAALVADGPTTIQNAEWVDISYPGFFDTLETLRG